MSFWRLLTLENIMYIKVIEASTVHFKTPKIPIFPATFPTNSLSLFPANSLSLSICPLPLQLSHPLCLSLPSLCKPGAPLSHRPHFPIFPATPKISFSHFPCASLTLLPCRPHTHCPTAPSICISKPLTRFSSLDL
ncbi:hypothetical protein AMTRI_Chr06g173250 [Amborella trichopoda]